MRVSQKERVKELEEWVNREREEIKILSDELSSLYWMKKEETDSLNMDGFNTLGCRVETKGESVSMSWFFYKFYMFNNKRKRTNNYIAKGAKKSSYSMTKLMSHCPDYMAETVEYVERGFTDLRKRLEKLRLLKIWIHHYKPVVGLDNTKQKEVEHKKGESRDEE